MKKRQTQASGRRPTAINPWDGRERQTQAETAAAGLYMLAEGRGLDRAWTFYRLSDGRKVMNYSPHSGNFWTAESRGRLDWRDAVALAVEIAGTAA